MGNIITSLMLTGGGARGAYQIGALKAIAEVLDSELKEVSFPFQSYVGASTGALNMASLLTSMSTKSFSEAVNDLEKHWLNLTCAQVYITDWSSLAFNGVNWIRSLAFAKGRSGTLSLLNPKPLHDLIEKEISFEKIREFISRDEKRSFAINCFCHNSSSTLTFYTGHPKYKVTDWKRFKRQSERSDFDSEHILASSAIPLLFPPVKIGNQYFADGSLRDYAPFSVPIHMGASKILMIGVKGIKPDKDMEMGVPTTGKIVSSLLNAIMSDLIDIDRERVERINELICSPSEDRVEGNLKLINFHILRPKTSITKMAIKHHDSLPSSIKYFLKGLGPKEETADLASYILFEKPYIQELIAMGHKDAISSKAELVDFLKS